MDGRETLKTQHEALYTGAVDVLRRQVGDITECVAWTPALNLAKILNPADFEQAQQDGNLQVVNDLGRRLATIPYGTRTVLALIISRGDEVGFSGHWNREVTIPLAVLRHVVDCSEDDLLEHLDVLHHAQLGWFDVPEYDGEQSAFQVGGSTGDTGWQLFAEIKTAARGDAKVVRRAIVDLDFTVLDA
jgi:hypothetical protein